MAVPRRRPPAAAERDDLKPVRLGFFIAKVLILTVPTMTIFSLIESYNSEIKTRRWPFYEYPHGSEFGLELPTEPLVLGRSPLYRPFKGQEIIIKDPAVDRSKGFYMPSWFSPPHFIRWRIMGPEAFGPGEDGLTRPKHYRKLKPTFYEEQYGKF